MATHVYCRACGDVHDPLLACKTHIARSEGGGKTIIQRSAAPKPVQAKARRKVDPEPPDSRERPAPVCQECEKRRKANAEAAERYRLRKKAEKK